MKSNNFRCYHIANNGDTNIGH